MSSLIPRPPKPSESLRPGLPRLLAQLTADPMMVIIRVVAAITEGVTTAILKWRDKRADAKRCAAEEKARKKAEGKGKSK